jgi:putative sterol carrier protein
MSDTPMTQEQLGELVDGRTDDEINETIAAVGTDAVLEQIFSAMQERFQPDKAAGQSAVIGWEITAPDGVRAYQVKVDNGTCTVQKDGTDAARVTLGLSLADFMRFIGGKLDGMQAFMGGKLKLQGDMMFAQTLQTWFGQ